MHHLPAVYPAFTNTSAPFNELDMLFSTPIQQNLPNSGGQNLQAPQTSTTSQPAASTHLFSPSLLPYSPIITSTSTSGIDPLQNMHFQADPLTVAASIFRRAANSDPLHLLEKVKNAYHAIVQKYDAYANLLLPMPDLDGSIANQPQINVQPNIFSMQNAELKEKAADSSLKVSTELVNFLKKIKHIEDTCAQIPEILICALIYKTSIYKEDILKKFMENNFKENEGTAELKTLFKMDAENLAQKIQNLGDAQNSTQILQQMGVYDLYQSIQEYYTTTTGQNLMSQNLSLDVDFSMSTSHTAHESHESDDEFLQELLSAFNSDEGQASTKNTPQPSAHTPVSTFDYDRELAELCPTPMPADLPTYTARSTSTGQVSDMSVAHSFNTFNPFNNTSQFTLPPQFPYLTTLTTNPTPQFYNGRPTLPRFDATQALDTNLSASQSQTQTQTQTQIHSQDLPTLAAPLVARPSRKRSVDQAFPLTQNPALRKIKKRSDDLETVTKIAALYLKNPAKGVLPLTKTEKEELLVDIDHDMLTKAIRTIFKEYLKCANANRNPHVFAEAMQKKFSETGQQNITPDLVHQSLELIAKTVLEYKEAYLDKGRSTYPVGIRHNLPAFLTYLHQTKRLNDGDLKAWLKIHEDWKKDKYTEVTEQEFDAVIPILLQKKALMAVVNIPKNDPALEKYKFSHDKLRYTFSKFLDKQIQEYKDQELSLEDIYQEIGEKYNVPSELVKKSMEKHPPWHKFVTSKFRSKP